MPVCLQRNFKRYCVDFLFDCLDFPFPFVVCLRLVLLYATLVLKLASNKFSLKVNVHSSCWFLDLYR